MDNSKRIHLLSSAEVEELYARPKFNAYEQGLYFTLSKPEQAALARHTHTKTRVYFILQLGYFKTKQQVFDFSLDDVSDDTQFIINTYYGETESAQLSGRISRDYARKQKQAILSLYGYRSWSSDYAPDTESHIGELLRYYPKGQFAALAEFLDGNAFDKKAAQWEFYAKSSRIFSLYLRPVFTTVVFEYYKDNSHIIGLIDLLKSHYASGNYASGKNPSALKICDDPGFTVPTNMMKYLKRKPTDGRIDPYLFEFFVYQKIYHEIDRGRLYCNDRIWAE